MIKPIENIAERTYKMKQAFYYETSFGNIGIAENGSAITLSLIHI